MWLKKEYLKRIVPLRYSFLFIKPYGRRCDRMSHIGNKIVSGFFATPERQGEYLKSLLSFTGDAAVFDPTCGEGKILKQLTSDQDYSLKTYGVEIDKGRAGIASKILDVVEQAPIESMIISHDVFAMVFLNPPYDHTMKGIGDEQSERKEYIELVRNTKYLMPKGIMIYIIPSYRFADKKIARFLSTQFEEVGIMRFSDEDYEDFKQCVFIGRKKASKRKALNTKLYDFLLLMENEEHVLKHVTRINQMVGRKTWEIPSGRTKIPVFYSRIESKSKFIDLIKSNKGFQAFKERSKPRQLKIGGNPLINISQGQLALLLASGAVNGLIGEGDTLHAVQGMEIVSNVITQEKEKDTTITRKRMKREVSVKIITPNGKIKKLV